MNASSFVIRRLLLPVTLAAGMVMLAHASMSGCVPVASSSDDAGPGSSATVTTSVSGDKVLSALSDSESQQFCNDVDNYIQAHSADQNLATCLSQAFDDGSALMTTSGQVLECKVSFRDCASSPSAVYLPDCSKWKTCGATVAEYSKCQDDTIAAAHLFTADSCNALSTEGGQKATLTPPSCASLTAKCPGL